MIRRATLRRWLSAFPEGVSPRELWQQQQRKLERAFLGVEIFYVCAFFVVFAQATEWKYWVDQPPTHLLWPIVWFQWVDAKVGVAIVLLGSSAATLAAAMAPGVRAARIAATIGLLLQSALFNSTAGAVIMHGYHGWIWTSAILSFLPVGRRPAVGASRAMAQRYLQVFWAAQTAVLAFYSLGGASKFLAAVWQCAIGEVHAFCPEALARHTAHRLLEGTVQPVYSLGPSLIENPAYGILFYPFAIYLELCSLLVAFRPALHRAWGCALILMHVGIYFVMSIMFSWQMCLVGILFLCSPFAKAQVGAGDVVRQLPLVGDGLACWRLLRRRRP